MKNFPSHNSAEKQIPDCLCIPHITAKTCASITGTSGSSFLTSFRFLSKEKSEALTKIYALFRIADDCVDEPATSQEKQVSLDFWRQETQLIYVGQPTHAISQELAPIINKYNIPQDYLMGLFDGCQMDIDKSQYATYEELKDYCYHVAGLVGLTCLKIFDYDTPAAKKMAIELGMAFQLTNIMRDIQDDLKIGRIYLAQEDLEQFHYSTRQLANREQNENFRKLMTTYYQRAYECYHNAFAEFKNDKDNKLIAARIMAKTYYRILKKMKRQRFPVLQKRVSLNCFEKLCILIPLFFRSTTK